MPDESRERFLRGIALYNRGEYFEAHEEMEEAMNLIEGDDRDWDFYLGLLRAAVAQHKLSQGASDSAILHLRAALKFLDGFPDRHGGIRLREFRNALNVQHARLLAAKDGGNDSAPPTPRIEFA